jgi:hypothetical protein
MEIAEAQGFSLRKREVLQGMEVGGRTVRKTAAREMMATSQVSRTWVKVLHFSPVYRVQKGRAPEAIRRRNDPPSETFSQAKKEGWFGR